MTSGPAPIPPYDNTWQRAIDRWSIIMAAHALRPRTIFQRGKRITQLSRELRMSLPDVTTEDLLIWTAHKGWKTVNHQYNFHSTIRLFFRAIQPDLAEALPQVKRPPSVPRPLPDTIYFAALDQVDERKALILKIARQAGDRRSETATLSVTDLILRGDGWTLYVHGKGGKDRAIPIPDDLAAAILHWANQLDDPNGWVFPGPNGHLSPGYIGYLARQALKLASPVANLHRLRHSYATKGVAETHDLLAMRDLLGHASVSTTEQYVQVVDGALRCVAEAAAPVRVA